MERIREIESTSNWILLCVDKRTYALFVEPMLLVELDEERCEDRDGLRAALDRTAAALGAAGAAAVAAAADEPRVSALNLNLTDKCNLACIYCYAKGGDYDRITEDMTLDTVKTALQAARHVVDDRREFRFEFFGGEPLLNGRTIEGVLDWQDEQDLLPRTIINRVSTNLTFLTPQVESLLRRGRFIVSVSLDGTKDVQDEQRPYKDGRGSYDDIVANVRRLKEAAPATVTVARMTAWRHGGALADEIAALRDLQLFDYCSVYPAAVEGDDEGAAFEDFRRAYLDFAGRYDEYLTDDDDLFKGCLELNRYLGHLLLGTVALNHCRAGAGYFALSPDGTVHPCHRLIGRPDHAIPGGLAGIPATPAFWRVPVTERATCRHCPVRYGCGGGCKHENLIATGDPLGTAAKNCRFSRLLLDAAVVAASGLSTGARQRLATICRGLSDLFVLCGQNVEGTDRAHLRAVAAVELAGWAVQSISPVDAA